MQALALQSGQNEAIDRRRAARPRRRPPAARASRSAARPNGAARRSARSNFVRLIFGRLGLLGPGDAQLDPAGQHRHFFGSQFRFRRHLIRFAIIDRVDQQAFARLARHDRRPGVAAGQHAGLRVEPQTSFGIARRNGTPNSAGPTAAGLSARRIRVPRPLRIGSGRSQSGRNRPGGFVSEPLAKQAATRPINAAVPQTNAPPAEPTSGQTGRRTRQPSRAFGDQARLASRYVPPGGWRVRGRVGNRRISLDCYSKVLPGHQQSNWPRYFPFGTESR